MTMIPSSSLVSVTHEARRELRDGEGGSEVRAGEGDGEGAGDGDEKGEGEAGRGSREPTPRWAGEGEGCRGKGAYGDQGTWCAEVPSTPRGEGRGRA